MTPEPSDEASAAPGPEEPPARGLRRLLRPRVTHRRGLLVLVLLLGGLGVLVGVGGTVAVHYSESSAFCGKCHAMRPELTAYRASPHKDVACAECHVAPGLAGWVRAKARGTQQLVEVVTGSFPRPIPAPDHADLPAVKGTCLRCHSLDKLTRDSGPLWFVMRPTYGDDRANTREEVSVVLRPGALRTDGSLNGPSAIGGVHGHVAQRISYSSSDSRAQSIDLVEVTLPDGTTKEFVSRSQTRSGTDLAQLRSRERTRTMDCLDCHNRVGHETPTAGRAVDGLLASGKLDPGLPYIKRDAVALLEARYPSQRAADTAIDGLRDRLRTQYPLVVQAKAAQVDQAVAQLKTAYRLVATPDLKVQPTTYADNLGHQGSPGCFRCHDGNHVQVVNGRVTNQTIPSTCATCHAFPQLGGLVSNYLADGRPTSHAPATWALTHKTLARSTDPTGTSCIACHTRSFCVNCHSTGAVKVRHTRMLSTHPPQVARLGAPSCAACHRPTFCVSCHSRYARPTERAS